jgi:hypothetical protein
LGTLDYNLFLPQPENQVTISSFLVKLKAYLIDF